MASTGDIQPLFRGGGREELAGEKNKSQACLVTIRHPDWSCEASHKSKIPHTYLRVMQKSVTCIMWEAVTGVEWIPCKGFLQHMLANRALVYPSQGGRYCAKSCMALG